MDSSASDQDPVALVASPTLVMSTTPSSPFKKFAKAVSHTASSLVGAEVLE